MHSITEATDKKDSKVEKTATISHDDECQCDLHLHMNSSLIPEIQHLDFALDSLNRNEMPQPKAKTYRSLLDYFSSRAPPSLS